MCSRRVSSVSRRTGIKLSQSDLLTSGWCLTRSLHNTGALRQISYAKLFRVRAFLVDKGDEQIYIVGGETQVGHPCALSSAAGICQELTKVLGRKTSPRQVEWTAGGRIPPDDTDLRRRGIAINVTRRASLFHKKTLSTCYLRQRLRRGCARWNRVDGQQRGEDVISCFDGNRPLSGPG